MLFTCFHSISQYNGVNLVASRSFYIEHRKCTGYARRDLTEKPPKFNSLLEWEPKKSTKIDVCVRICKHLLSRDDAPAMVFEKGQVIFPTIPVPALEEEVSQTTKIIIYQEFPSHGPLLRNVRTASLCLNRC